MTPKKTSNPDLDLGDWEPRDSDIVILMLGQTGSGKSTFINVAAGRAIAPVTDAMTSCTKFIRPFVITHPQNSTRVILVDTPGFNDTWVDDRGILKRIVDWLKQLDERGARATGIIYLHDITQSRVSKEGPKAPMSPVKLDHPSMSKNVVLATTKWEELGLNSNGAQREAELLDIYWKTMLEKGSTADRFTKTHKSAWQIADCIKQGQINGSSICLELANILGQLPEKPRATVYGFFTSLFWPQHKGYG
ncbi:P-loop containing nucleoside triphosphate hydrolase protein [Suillus paluster]|uniref:P-loop containing nucleoside triphosphate hydrolase protein n=1 Tax=Suillus paluster TaxID=48578 RepID=UPI001B87F563|nr:P-loop containing nucleoside triphosphate hydrolase protein [Suillus paluster]KAG1740776.1 P-loop containing nucleoside triphosphate hydrolase protein [Suillus paluster]